jgi:hypothetical protein
MPVTFKLGDLTLGSVSKMPVDKHIFPQDLLDVDRNDTNNSTVIAMAQLLQSLDCDNNPENGIDINATSIENIVSKEKFDKERLDMYLSEASRPKVSEDDARKHLEHTQETVEKIMKSDLPQSVTTQLNTPASILTQKVVDDLIYMQNEERLAYDVYNKLYTLFPEHKQLLNIPTKSEIKHIEAVETLAIKYDINITKETQSTPGVYTVETLQTLYDTLIAKGEASSVDAMQVGCMVEVADINDLNKDIQDAQNSNADDVVSTFNFLRDGSYSHYWAFDSGLKAMGVRDGCALLGEEFNHPEYPNNQKKGE